MNLAKMGSYYKCISGNVFNCGYDDIIKIAGLDYVNDLVELKKSNGQDLYMSYSSFVSNFIFWSDYAPDNWWNSDNITYGKKCNCGSHKTYGMNIPNDQHSDWCEIYEKNMD